MENSDRSIKVRKYRKSTVPRLRWTSELHDRFVEAVQQLGGKYKATPKRIMQMMAVRGLKISHIKSHLQMYRSMKNSADSNGFTAIEDCQQRKLEHITMLSLREVPQAPTHRIQGRRKSTDHMDESLFYYEYQGRKGSTDIIGMRKREEGEISWANIIELPASQLSPINSTSQSCGHCPINLDLTMSSYN